MMEKTPRYKVARATEQICGLLGIDPADVIRRMRRPPDFLANEGRGVTAAEFFEGWETMISISQIPDAPLRVGKAYANGPFVPAFFAFACSPNVQTGIERMGLFKPLNGPLTLHAHRSETALEITKSSNEPSLSLPVSFAASEMAFLIQAIRSCTGAQVSPLFVEMPGPLACANDLAALLGCDVTIGHASRMHLRLDDADRVLLSRSPEQWAALEPGYREALASFQKDQGIAARLRTVLVEMLPAGYATVNEAAARLRISARSLQRYLSAEGQNFQAVLDETRRTLALRYLNDTSLSVDEISYLLAYRDPNSFYRAFNGWTGATPMAVRSAEADRLSA